MAYVLERSLHIAPTPETANALSISAPRASVERKPDEVGPLKSGRHRARATSVRGTLAVGAPLVSLGYISRTHTEAATAGAALPDLKDHIAAFHELMKRTYSRISLLTRSPDVVQSFRQWTGNRHFEELRGSGMDRHCAARCEKDRHLLLCAE
jgi:hypothetical protein